ncbi:MAG: hypothetical protein NTV50_03730 [Planctomycetota bacterium]|nr:hypothetical protein [Planctomycetota bacterium]
MFRNLTSFVLFTACLGLALGCGGVKGKVPTKRVPVSGTVKLDGKPLAAGRVTFDAQNGEPPTTCDILNGAYSGTVMIGINKVMLISTVKQSMKEKMKMDGPGYDEMVEFNILPDRYHSKSEITNDVADPGPNQFDFDLQSK